jgi:hypothetical protein
MKKKNNVFWFGAGSVTLVIAVFLGIRIWAIAPLYYSSGARTGLVQLLQSAQTMYGWSGTDLTIRRIQCTPVKCAFTVVYHYRSTRIKTPVRNFLVEVTGEQVHWYEK